MTETYEALATQPRTGTEIDIGSLTPEERHELRTLQVRSTTGISPKQGGRFTDIHYLEGDEFQAIERFVDENKDILDGFEFTDRNVIESSLDRPLYELLLAVLGERDTRKYQHTVVEERPDGSIWVIQREFWEQYPYRHYGNDTPVAKLPADVDLDSLYEEAPTEIPKSYFSEAGVSGTLDPLVDFYLDCGFYACTEVSLDGQRGLRKSD